MSYASRFVASVLVNGVALQESPDGSVTMPFGCEYTLRFRNQHQDRRAVVKLFIDGTEQSKGGYVIPPRSYKDIERNSHSPRRFKFVAPNSHESEAAGKDRDNAEGFNGVVEARFYLEKEQPKVEEVHHHHHHYPVYPPVVYPPWAPKYPCYGSNCVQHTNSSSIGGSSCGHSAPSPSPIDCSTKSASLHFSNSAEVSPSARVDDYDYSSDNSLLSFDESPRDAKRSRKRETVAGVTVEGSHSSQTFVKVNIDLEETYTVVKIFLKGHQPEESVIAEEGVLDDEVVANVYCSQCGANRKPPKANFCHVCGHRYG